MARSLLPFLLAAPLLAPAPQNKEVPFAEFGKTYLKEHGNAAQASDLPFEKLRETYCVHAGLGAFDVYYPISFLSEKQDVEDLKTVLVALLELQTRWIDMLATDPAKTKPIKADIAELQKWVKGWNQQALANLKEEKGKDHDLFKALGANEAVQKA